MVVGDLVKFKNMVFSSYAKHGKLKLKYDPDHAFLRGRPCLYIGTYNDKMYFFSLSNNKSYANKYIIVPNNDNKLSKPSVVGYSNIIIKDASFYEITGYINEKDMCNIFKDMFLFYEEIDHTNIDDLKIVIALANNYLNSIEKSKVKKIKRNKRNGGGKV